ncbi:MAG: hypothetical protein RLZZ397_544 [Pseudomonadota bacterium]|jgi:osmotically-inducible protein OsmY
MIPSSRFIQTLLVATISATVLGACAPLVIGGAATGVFAATDRRTSGAQLEDQMIELKLTTKINQAFGDRAHVNVTSYNRTVLLTGEVPAEGDKAKVVQLAAEIENVNKTLNELVVGLPSSLTQRGNDVVITTKVKARLLDVPGVDGLATKVTTERGTVYLMGMLTPREIDAVTNAVRTVSGVAKVVRAFETITEDDLKRLQPRPPVK